LSEKIHKSEKKISTFIQNNFVAKNVAEYSPRHTSIHQKNANNTINHPSITTPNPKTKPTKTK
jgi:hypothetical protein